MQAGARVEVPRPTAKHDLPGFMRSKGEGESRGKVLGIGNVILPVVSEAERYRKARPNANFILRKKTQLFLPVHQLTGPLLLGEGERPSVQVVLEGRELERALKIRPVIETPAAELRKIDPGLDQLFAGGPGHRIGKRKVIVPLI